MAKQVLVELSVQDKQALARLREFDAKVFETLKKTDAFNKGMDGFFDTFAGKVVALNQGFELLGRAIQAFKKPLMDAAEAEVLQETFAGTAEQMELFRKATAGTVLDSSLIKLSNQARDLGLSMDQQAILFAAAEEAGDKYGVGVEEAFQKLVLVSEGATKGLKDLGIQKEVYERMVDNLAKAEGRAINDLGEETQKRIRLQAVIALTGITLDDVAKKESDSKDRLEQMGVNLDQLLENFGRVILGGLNPFVQALNSLLQTGSDVLTFMRDFIGQKSPALTVLTTLAGGAIGLGLAMKIGAAGTVTFMASLKSLIITLRAAVVAFIDQMRLIFMYNPWLVWIVGIGALAGAIWGLTRQTGELNDAIDEETGKIRQQQVEFNALIDIVKSDTAEKGAKKRAIEQLTEKYDGYLGKLDLEKASVKEIAAAQALANKEFEKAIVYRVADVRAKAKADEMAEAYGWIDYYYKTAADIMGKSIQDIKTMPLEQLPPMFKVKIDGAKEYIDKLLKETVDIYNETEQSLQVMGSGLGDKPKPPKPPKDNKTVIEKNIETMREELRILELRSGIREKEYLYLVKAIQNYNKLNDLLTKQKLTLKDELAVREEIERLNKQYSKLSINKKMPVINETVYELEKGLKKFRKIMPMDFVFPDVITDDNLNMLNEYAQTLEDVRDAAREAGRAMAREIGGAAQVFRQANSLVEKLINSFVELLVQMTALRLIGKILNLIPGFSEGGSVGASEGQPMAMAGGGIITGPGTGTSDSIPALLSNGEYVVNAKTARKYKPWLDYLNFGDPQKLALGGMVGIGGTRTIIVKQEPSDVRVSVEGVISGSDLRVIAKRQDRLNKRIR